MQRQSDIKYIELRISQNSAMFVIHGQKKHSYNAKMIIAIQPKTLIKHTGDKKKVGLTITLVKKQNQKSFFSTSLN